MVTGDSTAPPAAVGAPKKDGYQAIVALVNGGPDPVAVGPSRISLLVYKEGSPVACAGQD